METKTQANNKPFEPSNLQTVDLTKVFNSPANIYKNALILLNIAKKNGHNNGLPSEDDTEYFMKLAQETMVKFQKSLPLDYQLAYYEKFVDHVETFRALNNDYLKYAMSFLKWNAFVPQRQFVEVGPSDERRYVQMSRVQADEIPTIDVWEEFQIQVRNSNNRYNNRIPPYRAGIHSRYYDRDNEGLRYETFSRESPIYADDMSKIYAAIDKWKRQT